MSTTANRCDMIVVVDDHADTASALAALLRKGGNEAVALGCGEELFEHLAHSRPKLIVLDMAMPGIDGMECLRRLSASPQWRNIPVVVYSADFTYARMQAAMNAGARDFLVKGTVGWDELLKAIERHAGNTP